MSGELILWPMIVLALATCWLYIPMSKARVRAVKEGRAEAKTFRLNKEEPEESLQLANAIRNQYETPVLFYAVSLAAYASGNAGWLMTGLAFLYVALKLAHIGVHVTSNRLSRRRPIFIAAYSVLILMWLVFAAKLLLY